MRDKSGIDWGQNGPNFLRRDREKFGNSDPLLSPGCENDLPPRYPETLQVIAKPCVNCGRLESRFCSVCFRAVILGVLIGIVLMFFMERLDPLPNTAFPPSAGVTTFNGTFSDNKGEPSGVIFSCAISRGSNEMVYFPARADGMCYMEDAPK